MDECRTDRGVGSPDAEGGVDGEVNVLLAVDANEVGRDVHDLKEEVSDGLICGGGTTRGERTCLPTRMCFWQMSTRAWWML